MKGFMRNSFNDQGRTDRSYYWHIQSQFLIIGMLLLMSSFVVAASFYVQVTDVVPYIEQAMWFLRGVVALGILGWIATAPALITLTVRRARDSGINITYAYILGILDALSILLGPVWLIVLLLKLLTMTHKSKVEPKQLPILAE